MASDDCKCKRSEMFYLGFKFSCGLFETSVHMSEATTASLGSRYTMFMLNLHLSIVIDSPNGALSSPNYDSTSL